MTTGEVNETWRAIGALQASVEGLQRTVHALAETWQHQDNEATDGRRELYRKFEDLRIGFVSMQGDFTALNRRLDTLTPIVKAGEAAELQKVGAFRLLKLLWNVVYALIAASGGIIYERFHGGGANHP